MTVEQAKSDDAPNARITERNIRSPSFKWDAPRLLTNGAVVYCVVGQEPT